MTDRSFASKARALIELNHSIDPVAWAHAYDAGLKPDRAPYGLGRMSEFGIEPVFSKIDVSRPSRLAAAGLRRVGGGFDWWHSARRRAVDDVDLRLCWEERDGVPSALTRRHEGAPVFSGVIWITDAGSETSSRATRIIKQGLSKCEAIWTLSSAQISSLRTDWEVPDARIRYVKFGIDTDFWAPRHNCEVGNGVLTVGNDRHRDHPTLVRAMSSLTEATLSDHPLTLISDQTVEVASKVGNRLGSMSHAELRSKYEETAIFAAACRPNLHVSGMTAILEAQSMGVPVVCTETPGIRDYVVDGVTALLVPPGDHDGLAAAIDSLLNDPQRRAEMGAAGADFVRRECSTSHLASRLADVIHDFV